MRRSAQLPKESLLRHVRFVRDHHRKVPRVALAADSKLASLAPPLAEHFVQAEVRGFRYDELESAIAWAAGPAGRRSEAPATAHLPRREGTHPMNTRKRDNGPTKRLHVG
jgi:hypothetical protein